jgi:hypothetical protein
MAVYPLHRSRSGIWPPRAFTLSRPERSCYAQSSAAPENRLNASSCHRDGLEKSFVENVTASTDPIYGHFERLAKHLSNGLILGFIQ